jgi:D-3-phosphoglycerate dehydrogenase
MPKVRSLSLNSHNGPHYSILRANGFEVECAPKGKDLFKEDDLIDVLADCDAVVAGSERYTRRVIESAPKLRAIARSGVGYDAVDLAACDKAGIVVTITPGVNHHTVAEHTIALLMGVSRGFPEMDRRVRENRWLRIARPRVMGRTLGILGLGRIGRAVATRAVGLGLKVLAYDPYPNREFAEQWGVELTSFDDLLSRSDYVSLHSAASAQTRHMINAQTLARMKRGAVLINTSRGSMVDEKALYEALKSGQLRAAGLDVFEVEPLPLDSPLLKLDNVLLSGHVAGLDIESNEDTFVMLANTLVKLHQGSWPAECVVNLKGVTDWKWNRD